ncbi:FecR domain-containing protein [uncultured Alistipes sp.]|uniref:FecR family protein n=1 Tax=uncultured Alistipes sp. TaxID=538949 RepID=UPI0026390D6F|nr:FecR domain-containing protein [uncultured Alistipes sp.]
MEEQKIRDLFAGDGMSDEAQATGRWLAEHAGTEEADSVLSALLKEVVPADADAGAAFRRVCRRLGIAARPNAWRLVGRWTLRVAACLFIPVAVAAFYLYGEAQRPSQWFEAYAPYGKTLRVELPDRSVVVLNSGSKLIYPDRFAPDRRQVFLAGEGYASIEKDPERPFVMSAGEVDVRVLGTKFNLKSYAEDSEVEVTLVEGCVEMATKLGTNDRVVRLRPGELVKLDKESGNTETFEVLVSDFRPVVLGGGLFFMDKRFDEIAAYFEKRFDVKINIYDPALGEKRFIASFVNGESLDEMLATFNTDGEMRIKRKGRVINITKR